MLKKIAIASAAATIMMAASIAPAFALTYQAPAKTAPVTKSKTVKPKVMQPKTVKPKTVTPKKVTKLTK